MIINTDFRGVVSKELPTFTYTGQYKWTPAEDKSWRLELLTSGTLEFTAPKSARNSDIFLVGGGSKGGDGWQGSSTYWGQGGNGGRGGECITIKETKLRKQKYKIVIGNTGQNTSIQEITGETLFVAKGGAGASGGSGASGKSGNGGNGSRGTPEFNEEGSQRYAGGGGGGTRQGTEGQGRDGGGSGNWNAGLQANSGGGGGGGGYGYLTAQEGLPGATGIIIIRNHRK